MVTLKLIKDKWNSPKNYQTTFCLTKSMFCVPVTLPVTGVKYKKITILVQKVYKLVKELTV